MTETFRLRKAVESIRFARARMLHEAHPPRLLSDLADAFVDLTSLFHDLGVGTLVVDPHGRVAFATDTIPLKPGLDPATARGRAWHDVLDADPESIERAREMMQRPESSRERLLLTADDRALGLDVRDDPGDRRRRILFLYEAPSAPLSVRPRRIPRSSEMIGSSSAMLQLNEFVEQVAGGDWTVLVEGETGTGKELVARAIHESSERNQGPFVAVNCAGLTDSLLGSQLFGHAKGAFTGATSDRPGFFEAASGGTLFLDEIGDITVGVQTALLRVLQDKEILRVGDTRPRKVNVRIIAATHRNLSRRVSEGLFREDLLYRIRVARVRVPPLRERRDDIPLLAQAFLEPMQKLPGRSGLTLSEAAVESLIAHDWPGNVRELKSAIEHAVIHCRSGVIEPFDLPPEVHARQATAESVLEALRLSGGNRTKAARLLRIGRATLYRRLNEMNGPGFTTEPRRA